MLSRKATRTHSNQVLRSYRQDGSRGGHCGVVPARQNPGEKSCCHRFMSTSPTLSTDGHVTQVRATQVVSDEHLHSLLGWCRNRAVPTRRRSR